MKRNLALAAMIACAMFAAACGSDDSETASEEPAATATAEDGGNTKDPEELTAGHDAVHQLCFAAARDVEP